MNGLNAAGIILASGFPGETDLGHVPAAVLQLALLPEAVTLVRANEQLNFKLAATVEDALRADTSLMPWIVKSLPAVIVSPDYYFPGNEALTFQLSKRIEPHPLHCSVEVMRVVIKFVPTVRAGSRTPELWVRTLVLHTVESIAPYLNAATRLAG